MSYITIKKQACLAVPEFIEICTTFTRKFLVAGKSYSCVQHYLLQISKLVLFYNRSPLDLTSEEVEDFLVYTRINESPSQSRFKHLVCGLRHIYSMYNKNDLHIILPKVRQPKMLPVVFSKEEIRLLLKTPECLKQRIILGTIYDSGLRISEVRQLLISDIDLNRRMLHVRQSKYKKDRYVPISEMLVRGIKQYIKEYQPTYYLFNGRKKEHPMSDTSTQRIMRISLKKSKIEKKASIHSLRHSYATHLLEDGLDIVSLKNQLGHADIKNTMTYIHVARISPNIGFSPLKNLYNRESIITEY
jgi:site-specific recombinase XerD